MLMDFCESIFFDEICQVTAFACDFQYRAVCPVLIVYIFFFEFYCHCFQNFTRDSHLLFSMEPE